MQYGLSMCVRNCLSVYLTIHTTRLMYLRVCFGDTLVGYWVLLTYMGADKFLALPTSRCILFDGENSSFDASLVIYIYIYIYINSTNIPPIMIINRIYETQNFLSL